MTQTERNFRYRHKRAKLAAYRTIVSLKDIAHSDPKLQALLAQALADYERHNLAYQTGMRGLTRRGATPTERLGMADLDNEITQPKRLVGIEEFDPNEIAASMRIKPFVPPPITAERRAELDRLGKAEEQHAEEYIEQITETPEERRTRKLAEAKAADDQILRLVGTRSLGKKDGES